MSHILALSLSAVLSCFGLWPLAILTVLAFWLPNKLREEQHLQNVPIVHPTFEQKQIMAIVAAHESGQFEQVALLERKFQQEW